MKASCNKKTRNKDPLPSNACTLGGGFMFCDVTSVVDMLLLAFNVVFIFVRTIRDTLYYGM